MSETDERTTEEADSVVGKAWRSLRQGFEWFADTFRGHAHVREMENERE